MNRGNSLLEFGKAPGHPKEHTQALKPRGPSAHSCAAAQRGGAGPGRCPGLSVPTYKAGGIAPVALSGCVEPAQKELPNAPRLPPHRQWGLREGPGDNPSYCRPLPRSVPPSSSLAPQCSFRSPSPGSEGGAAQGADRVMGRAGHSGFPCWQVD